MQLLKNDQKDTPDQGLCIPGILQYLVIYSVMYEVHLNQLSCSFLVKTSAVVFLSFQS